MSVVIRDFEVVPQAEPSSSPAAPAQTPPPAEERRREIENTLRLQAERQARIRAH